MRFEVPTASSTKTAVFWVVAPYSLVEIYRSYRRITCCLHHQGALSHKTVIFIFRNDSCISAHLTSTFTHSVVLAHINYFFRFKFVDTFSYFHSM